MSEQVNNNEARAVATVTRLYRLIRDEFRPTGELASCPDAQLSDEAVGALVLAAALMLRTTAQQSTE